MESSQQAVWRTVGHRNGDRLGIILMTIYDSTVKFPWKPDYWYPIIADADKVFPDKVDPIEPSLEFETFFRNGCVPSGGGVGLQT